MAALLRSVATKMPRIPSALLDRHGLLFPTASRFTTSTGSTSQANLRGPQTGNKKFLSDREWDRAKTTAIETATTCAFLTVAGGVLVICGWFNPTLDRINGNLEASNRLDMEKTDALNRRHQRICKQCGSRES